MRCTTAITRTGRHFTEVNFFQPFFCNCNPLWTYNTILEQIIAGPAEIKSEPFSHSLTHFTSLIQTLSNTQRKNRKSEDEPSSVSWLEDRREAADCIVLRRLASRRRTVSVCDLVSVVCCSTSSSSAGATMLSSPPSTQSATKIFKFKPRCNEAKMKQPEKRSWNPIENKNRNKEEKETLIESERFQWE